MSWAFNRSVSVCVWCERPLFLSSSHQTEQTCIFDIFSNEWLSVHDMMQSNIIGFICSTVCRPLPFRHFCKGIFKCKIIEQMFEVWAEKNWALFINNGVDSTQKSKKSKTRKNGQLSHILHVISLALSGLNFAVDAFFGWSNDGVFVCLIGECVLLLRLIYAIHNMRCGKSCFTPDQLVSKERTIERTNQKEKHQPKTLKHALHSKVRH